MSEIESEVKTILTGTVMPEIESEVKTFIIDYVCDECKVGTLSQTGIVLTCQPPLFEHHCSYCGKRFNLVKRYPDIQYKKVKQNG